MMVRVRLYSDPDLIISSLYTLHSLTLSLSPSLCPSSSTNNNLSLSPSTFASLRILSGWFFGALKISIFYYLFFRLRVFFFELRSLRRCLFTERGEMMGQYYDLETVKGSLEIRYSFYFIFLKWDPERSRLEENLKWTVLEGRER